MLAEKGSSFGQSQDDLMLVPITTFFGDFGRANRTVNIATQSTSQATYNQTLDKAIGAMRAARGLKLAQENDFEIYSNDTLVAAFAQIADTIRIGAFVVSAIALLAAGIGIMNIMLVSVTERTREIGVRKAIGARRNDIVRQFLLEAIVLSEVGGLAGIIFGVVGGNGVAFWLDMSMVFPWGWALTGLIVCSLIGTGFGWYPAWKAASLAPDRRAAVRVSFDLEKTVALLSRTPAVFDTWLRDLPDDWIHSSEGENTFSPFDVVGHLIHGERTDWMPRARMILQDGENRPFEKFDRLAQNRESQGKSLGELLHTFAALRSQNLDDLRSLKLQPADFDRRGCHPELGTVTLGQLIATWAAHDLTHIHQVSRVMAHQYRGVVGPWTDYLGVMRCNGHSS